MTNGIYLLHLGPVSGKDPFIKDKDGYAETFGFKDFRECVSVGSQNLSIFTDNIANAGKRAGIIDSDLMTAVLWEESLVGLGVKISFVGFN